MARWYQCFETMEERKAWEKKKQAENKRFKVCMRMTAKQLEQDLYMPKGELDKYKYATIYTFKE